LSEKHPYKVYFEPELESASLVVGWNEDAGGLGAKSLDYMNEKLGGREFAEIEPADFFPLGGVSVEDDVARFPESKFYCCPENNLLIFKSNIPRSDWYRFLDLVLNIAENYCHVKELYTVGGMIYLGAHTIPREIMAIANSPDMKAVFGQYDLAADIDYESPPGQRPTLNSFLLWVARRRSIAGANFWVPIPFYLVSVGDPEAWRKPLEFLDIRFDLGLDFTDLDEHIVRHNNRIAQLRTSSPEIDGYISRLESNQTLTQEEYDILAKEVEEFLRERD
jgi:proteasome assembly chaperone (PAC2) family protein